MFVAVIDKFRIIDENMIIIFKKIVRLFFFLAVSMTVGQLSAGDVLPANAVFIPQIVDVSKDNIRIDIDIKPGYYLYRRRLFDINAPAELRINDIQLSDGIIKQDEFFGKQSVWYGGKNTATITINYDNPSKLSSAQITLKYQGCQDGVICYPPQTVSLPLTLPKADHQMAERVDGALSKEVKAVAAVASKAPNRTTALLFGQSDRNVLLSEDEAFPFFIERVDAQTLAIRWRVAKNYYLYRDKINIDSSDTAIASLQFSPGELHSDKHFGEQKIYRGDNGVVFVHLAEQSPSIRLNLSYQGCADRGVCYPVMKRHVNIAGDRMTGSHIGSHTGSDATNTSILSAQPGSKSNSTSSSEFRPKTDSTPDLSRPQGIDNLSSIDRLTQTLSGNLWLGVGLLLLAGIALSFTPCVLPMLPILLGIITNQHQVSKKRAAALSSAYALGVATMMAVFGLIVAKTGINIQIVFQQPVWLILFALFFILMGLAMLGVFSIAMPNRVQSKIIQWQNQFQGANLSSLFIVGALSTLIVGPCIAPPLIAILAFISTTGDSVLGALYLFSLGLGMSLPLVCFATLVTSIPKTGELSRLITRLFAMLLFGVGLWLLTRLLPGAVGLALWGILVLVVAAIFWRNRFVAAYAKRISQGLSLICLAIGLTWLSGGVMGNSNPLAPWTTATKLPFRLVHTLAEFENILAESEQPVMFDLYADWCVSCQENEHVTLAKATVAEALADVQLVKLDITNTNDAHRKMLAKLDLVGPPALLFFSDGKEIKSLRHIGAIDEKALIGIISRLKQLQK
ncbi:MAG: hypothetical protein CSA47_00685 [Gammaproteobacteria bacterium]|nr:MAG: hypothetical protein CSA47_00685 [Gammaproteobacteria bacterium]